MSAVFVISVGSIPPGETATTQLTYVSSTMNDDIVNSIRFSLPTCVGWRYGSPPEALDDAASPSNKTRIRITVDVQMSGSITLIRTPNYDEYVTQELRNGRDGRPSKRKATIKLRSKTYLEREFTLIIQADKLDRPRCFAEMRDDGRLHTLALQLTLLPRYNLPQVQDQEYIFVIDKSSSMSGDPIEQAKKTAAVLLRLLPKDGTFFNIVVFDDAPSALWASSVEYNETSLALAVSAFQVARQHLLMCSVRNPS